MKLQVLKYYKLFIAALISVFLISCGSSTGSRYGKEDNSGKQTENTETEKTLNEDFDITPYKIEITIPEKKENSNANTKNVWFDYDSPVKDVKVKSLVGTADGYRVIILTTDNLEAANKIKDDIVFSKDADEVYIDFEPPFYKVKVGDFESSKPAEDLRFKLSQLGYKEAKVIRDKINLFK